MYYYRFTRMDYYLNLLELLEIQSASIQTDWASPESISYSYNTMPISPQFLSFVSSSAMIKSNSSEAVILLETIVFNKSLVALFPIEETFVSQVFDFCSRFCRGNAGLTLHNCSSLAQAILVDVKFCWEEWGEILCKVLLPLSIKCGMKVRFCLFVAEWFLATLIRLVIFILCLQCF